MRLPHFADEVVKPNHNHNSRHLKGGNSNLTFTLNEIVFGFVVNYSLTVLEAVSKCIFR